MATNSYTLILTKGLYTIRSSVAETIRAAIENGDKTVEVDIDLLSGPNSSRRTLLICQHVVALSEDLSQKTTTLDSNVVPLRAI